MKKQVVFIHGGNAFDTYEEYLEDLRAQEYGPYEEHGDRWKNTLAIQLGEDHEVLMPSMPSKYNAKYLEWKIMFEKVVPYLKDGVTFIGHSLGGIFLAKYFSEENFSKEIKAVYLVAAPFHAAESDYSLADFVLSNSLERLDKQGGEITLYHSEDDFVVPFDAVKKYSKALPSAKVVTFSDRNHFLQPEFPEIVESIKSVSI